MLLFRFLSLCFSTTLLFVVVTSQQHSSIRRTRQLIDNCTFDLVDPGVDPCFWIKEESPDSAGKCNGYDSTPSQEPSDRPEFSGWTEWNSVTYFPNDPASQPSPDDNSESNLVRCPIAFINKGESLELNSTANMTDDESLITYGTQYTILESTNCLFWPLNDHTGDAMQYQYAVLRKDVSNRARLMFNCQNYILNATLLGNDKICLSFWYYLQPLHDGAVLRVTQRRNASCYAQLYSTGLDENVEYGRWAQAKVKVPLLERDGQLYFEAARINEKFAMDGVALDDIVIYHSSHCDDVEPQAEECIDYMSPEDAVIVDKRIIRDQCNVENATSCINWKPVNDQFRPWRANTSILNAGDRVLARCWSNVQMESCVLWPDSDHTALQSRSNDNTGKYFFSLFKANVSLTPHTLMFTSEELLDSRSAIENNRTLCLGFWYVMEQNHDLLLTVTAAYHNDAVDNQILWRVVNGSGEWTYAQVPLLPSQDHLISRIWISASKVCFN